MNRHVIAALLFFASFFTSSAVRAQGVSHAYQSWFALFAQGPIVGPVYFQGDLHYRGYDNLTPYWALVRPGVGVLLRPGMFVTVGYAWTPSWRMANLGFGDRIDEHRLWEQWQYEVPVAGGALRVLVRVRFEQRWRPAVSDDVGHRLRVMARVTIPLRGPWILAAWDELFVTFNSTEWGQRGGFDQNRIFVGAGLWAVAGTLRLELGYFNQFIRRAGHPEGDLANHAAMLNTFVVWR